MTPRPSTVVVPTASPTLSAPARAPHLILGTSPPILALRRDLERTSRSPASTVLILGETGTGKELVARALHDGSSRAAGPFVGVNCSAVPLTLLEEEFFGYEAGAFTDARKQKQGLLEAAHGGTFFLDEIGELAPPLQAKLLRFLEERSFRKLGGTRDVSVDVRFVAATNVDLEELVRRGSFRQDLFYRLQVVTLRMPALREHPEDIPLLAQHFLEHYSARFHKAFREISPEARRMLANHNWPGNVRELRNTIERVVLLEDPPVVRAGSLVLGGRREAASATSDRPTLLEDLDLKGVEVRTLARALVRSAGNVSKAARLLGVSRDTVRHRMAKYGIRVETNVVVERPDPAAARPRVLPHVDPQVG